MTCGRVLEAGVPQPGHAPGPGRAHRGTSRWPSARAVRRLKAAANEWLKKGGEENRVRQHPSEALPPEHDYVNNEASEAERKKLIPAHSTVPEIRRAIRVDPLLMAARGTRNRGWTRT